jgi:tetratricopeptide (TPR) repeat protein
VLKQLPSEVVVANSLLADGDLEPAEEVLREYLRQDPDNVGALRLLARIRMERGAPDEAEALAGIGARSRAGLSRGAPRLRHGAAAAGRSICRRGGRPSSCSAHDPDNRDYLKQYGAACVGLGDHEPVIDLYEELLAQPAVGPRSPTCACGGPTP